MGEGVLLAYIFFQGFGTSLGQAYVVAVRPFGRGVPLDADADDLAVRIILHGVDGRENLLQLLRVASVVGMYLGTVHGEVDVG